MKSEYLPRQARDKHKERSSNAMTCRVFCQETASIGLIILVSALGLMVEGKMFAARHDDTAGGQLEDWEESAGVCRNQKTTVCSFSAFPMGNRSLNKTGFGTRMDQFQSVEKEMSPRPGPRCDRRRALQQPHGRRYLMFYVSFSFNSIICQDMLGTAMKKLLLFYLYRHGACVHHR